MARIRVKKSPGNPAIPNQTAPGFDSSRMQKPSTSVARTIQSVPRDEANIEAEKGETALVPDKGGLPAHFNIDGARHTGGGTPLNVPKDTFIFSDTKKMRIKDPEILAEFGKGKGSWTPADLAKKYDINKFRKLVQDPDSDPIQIRTAEKMIANYNLKLGKLALVQESKKGFPQGIPAVAMPYLSTFNISPDNILPLKAKGEQQQEMSQQMPQGKYGLSVYRKAQDGYIQPDPITMDPNRIMQPPVTPDLFGPGQTMNLPPSNTGMWNTPPGNVPPVVSPQPDQWEHSTGTMKYKPGHASMNPEDKVNWGLAGAQLVTSAFNAADTRKREADLKKRYAADKIFASNDQRDRGDYTRNFGYFRPDQQNVGNMITGKYGGVLPKAQIGLEGQDPEALKKFYEEAIGKRKLKEAAEQFAAKKASTEFYAKQATAKLSAKQATAKKKLDEAYETLEQLSGKKYLPIGHSKKAIGFDKAYDQYVDAVGQYTTLFPTPVQPVMDTSGKNPNVPYQNIFKPVMPAPAASWPTKRVKITPPGAPTAKVMTVQDYMSQYGVDEAIATELKKAEE